jgi:hypothetical protein
MAWLRMCSGLRTGYLGLANTGRCGPAIGAKTRPRGLTLSANGPTLVCERLANRPAGQHALRTGSRPEHQRLARPGLPSVGGLQGKRSILSSFTLVFLPMNGVFFLTAALCFVLPTQVRRVFQRDQ